MNILYVSAAFDDKIMNQYFTMDNKPQFAASKYHSLLAEGFAVNGANVNFFSALPITRHNCKRLFVKPKTNRLGIKKTYSVIVNMPIIKNLIVAMSAFMKTLLSTKDTVVVYDCLVLSASLGTLLAAKIRNFKTICIVTDLPVFMDVGKSKKLLSFNNWIINEASGYILLTKAMNEAIGNKGKPYIVMEGHCDIKMAECSHDTFENDRIVMYAGSINQIYGIAELCSEFLRVCNKGERLIIFGGGDFQDKLRELSERHSQIVYYGTCENETIVQNELHVSILVNPRCNDEYTKYSFPSKTMEYMASGTPVLMSELSGLPEDYKEYLTIFNENIPQDLGDKLRYLMDLSNAELETRGRQAKDFIVKNKNNVEQAKRILTWISTVIR